MQSVFVRSILLYAFVVAAMRFMGKRQLGELSASEFVVTIMISELAAIPIQDSGVPLLHGVVPIMILIGLEFLLTFGVLKFLRVRAVVCGLPSIVVREGRIVQSELKKNRMSADELIEELRKKDVTNIMTVHYAILEPGGQLSVVVYPNDSPAKVKDLGLTVQPTGAPLTLISDGRFIVQNLNQRGVDKTWVEQWLRNNGKLPAHDIFLMTLDDSGEVYAVERDGARKDVKS